MKTLLALSTILIGNAAQAAPPSGGDWTQIWNDEFSGSSLSSTRWVNNFPTDHTRGSVSWNHDMDFVEVSGGKLVTFFEKEANNDFGAGYATTHQKFGTTYGYFEAHIYPTTISHGQSAFWMQPFAGNGRLSPNNSVNNSANDAAEIDIFESKAKTNQYSAGIICDNYNSQPNVCSDTRDDSISATGFRNGYNTYALNWTPEKMEFLYNGVVKHTVTTASRIVHVPERLILSVGVIDQNINGELSTGGTDKTGKVDWIRVHKNNEMDWGDGYFKIINRDTGDALTAQSSGFAIPAAFQNGDNAQLWQIEKNGTCGEDLYGLKSKAHGNYVKAGDQTVPGNPQALNPEVKMAGNAVCEWSIEFESNQDGKDYYDVSTDDSGYRYYLSDSHPQNTYVTQLPISGSTWQIVWVED